MKTSKYSKYVLLFVPVLIGYSFDLLFIEKPFGINFPIFIILLLAGGFSLAQFRSAKPDPKSLILVLPILIFSGYTVFRQEPFTHFIDLLLTLAGLVMLIITFRGGRWSLYSLSDITEKVFTYSLFVITKPFQMLSQQTKASGEDQPKATNKVWISILRGALLALPIILVLTALLTSADVVFEKNLKTFFGILDWESFIEFTVRTILVLFLSLFITVTYIFAHERSDDTELRGLEKPGLPAFVGQIETVVVLTLVNFLFLLFVIVQFQYLFGGQVNIHIDGYTYAEYARKGFGEMSAVATLSLLLLQAARSLTRVDQPKLRSAQTALSVLTVAQLMVILFSAFQRLALYEAAYGFSRVRTYTHTFIVWLALLLITVVILEIKQRSRLFPLAVLCAACGFGLTVNIMNVDARIVDWNIRRAEQYGNLDISYLSALSLDAAPALVSNFNRTEGEEQETIGAAIECFQAKLRADERAVPWQGIHFGRNTALKALDSVQPQLAGYILSTDEFGADMVTVNGNSYSCFETTTD